MMPLHIGDVSLPVSWELQLSFMWGDVGWKMFQIDRIISPKKMSHWFAAMTEGNSSRKLTPHESWGSICYAVERSITTGASGLLPLISSNVLPGEGIDTDYPASRRWLNAWKTMQMLDGLQWVMASIQLPSCGNFCTVWECLVCISTMPTILRTLTLWYNFIQVLES